MSPSLSADASSPPPAASREARAAAIEARLGIGTANESSGEGGNGGTSSNLEEARRAKEEQELLLRLRRIVDLKIRRDNGYEQAAACLKLLDTLIGNILEHPEEDKYCSFKDENPRISQTVLSVSGGPEYLLEAGFGARTVAFKKEWFIQGPPVDPSNDSAAPMTRSSSSSSGSSSSRPLSQRQLSRLSCARRVLRDRLDESQGRADAAKERLKREEEVEKNRVQRALAEAEEDRERVKRRSERERAVRVREEAEEEQRRRRQQEKAERGNQEKERVEKETNEDLGSAPEEK